MRFLLFLFLFLPLSCFAQGFGSFSHDQPFLALDEEVNLSKGLLSYWPMDETTTGRRVDVMLNADLLDWTNSVGSSTGGMRNGCVSNTLLSAGSRLYSRHTQFSGTNSFTISLWERNVFNSGNNNALSRWDNLNYSGQSLSLRVEQIGSERIWQLFANDNGATAYYFDMGAKATPANAWTHYVVGWDAASKTGWFQTNAGPRLYTLVLTNGLTNVTCEVAPFTLFDYANSPNFSAYGAIDEMGFWNRTLNTKEVDLLYSGGNGYAYTNFAIPPTLGLPKSIGSMIMWLAADDGVTNTSGAAAGNGDNIYMWSDRSSLNASPYNQRQATPISSTAAAIFSTSGPNSKPCVTFSGANVKLGNTNAMWITATNPIVMFAVVKQTDTSGSQNIFGTRPSDVSLVVTLTGSGSYIYGHDGTFYYLPRFTCMENAWALVSACWDSAGSWVRTNAVKMATGTCNGGPITSSFSIGNYWSGADDYRFKGQIAEFILFNKQLTTNQIQSVESYLNTKYAIY